MSTGNINSGSTGTGQTIALVVVLAVILLGGVVLAFAFAGKPPQDGARAAAPLGVPPGALQQNGQGNSKEAPPANLTQWPMGGTDASRLHDLVYKSPGKAIAQGTNIVPTGPNKLKTYRVEEIFLPQGSVVVVKGQDVKADKVWRVTISGGPFVVADTSWILWVDNTSLGAGQESPNRSELTFITNDRSLLREGASLAISFGEDSAAHDVLLEKLHFSTSR